MRFELHNVPGVEELLSYSLAGHYYFSPARIMNIPVRFFAGSGWVAIQRQIEHK
ncbi:MAG: hypothetical protein ACKO1F_00325 [Flammeovirgaceae bacterium]